MVGLDETMVLTRGILKQHTSKAFMVKEPTSDSLVSLPEEGRKEDDLKLMSMASLLNDDSIFFLHGTEVKKMDIANGRAMA